MVNKEKIKKVEIISKLMLDYPIVGIINMENLPAYQLQKMRSQLREDVVILMAKKRLINFAIDKVKEKKKGIEKLKDYLKGLSALIFTSKDPFSLYKTLKKSKSKAPAKPGQVAPSDIIVKAGPTQFSPGPIISELASVGIKTSVESGKLSIKEDVVVVKEGGTISEKVASVLSRLGVEPMEIGLNLLAVYDNGFIFTKNILSVDEEEYKKMIADIFIKARYLAVEVGYLCKDVIEELIKRAYINAKAVAIDRNIYGKDVIKDIFMKAEIQAGNIKSSTNI